jgi:hypothetical protein
MVPRKIEQNTEYQSFAMVWSIVMQLENKHILNTDLLLLSATFFFRFFFPCRSLASFGGSSAGGHAVSFSAFLVC